MSMMTKPAVRVYATSLIVLAHVLLSSPASAQYGPRRASGSAIGDNYHIELNVGYWIPSADMTLSNTALDVAGTSIDLKKDLGLQDKRFPDFQLILRAAQRHKLRVEFVPVKYTQTGAPRTSLAFAGQMYASGVPVTSTIDWKAWRFGYEYDLVATPRGFMGVILNLKRTDVNTTLTNATAGLRTSSATATVPAFGAILRVNPISRVSLTGEITGLKLPWLASWIKSASGSYLDFDAYATLNFVNSLGVQAGYRSYDLDYTLTNDNGTFKVAGPYIGAVLLF
jgi:hypothetical protein